MRVVFCAQDGPGNFAGGPNAWLLRLLPDLRDRGWEITVLATGTGPTGECPLLSGLERQAITFRFLDHEGEGHYLNGRIDWMIRQLNEIRPAVFVPNLSIAGYHTAGLARRAGLPTVGVIHSDDAFHHRLLDCFIYGEFDRTVSAVVAVSRHLETSIRKRIRHGTELHLIPYGVPIPPAREQCADDPLRICYIGRFKTEQKRILDVTTAFCEASTLIPDARFTLLGNGPERPVMKEIIDEADCSDAVRLQDPIPSTEISSFLEQQDVFVLLSDYEGLSIALQEAMASGVVPVCLYERSGVAELIEDKVNGLIVKNRGTDFLQALETLEKDRGLLRRLSDNSRNTIVSRYAAPDQHARWHHLLETLAAGAAVARRIPKRKAPLPPPEADFRGEDIPAPPLSRTIAARSKSTLRALRQAVRPRSRIRSLLGFHDSEVGGDEAR